MMAKQLKVDSKAYDDSFVVPETKLYAGDFIVGIGACKELPQVELMFYAFKDSIEPTIHFVQQMGQALQLAAAILEQAQRSGYVESYQILVGDKKA